MSDAHLERRSGLFPHLGLRVDLWGVAVRGAVLGDGPRRWPCTLVALPRVGGPRARPVGHHVWLRGADLLYERVARPGDLFAASVVVHDYRSYDARRGREVARYGVSDPAGVRVVGPANLADIVRELAGVWGWDAVADAVAGQMTTEGA